MEKKFCEQCAYLSDESDLIPGRHYKDISFRNNKDKKIQCGTPICVVKKEIHEEIHESPIRRQVRLSIIVDDPEELNEKNDCALFKESLSVRARKWVKSKLHI